MTEKRHQWASNLGFILAAAGSAVGLGNIWKFPGKVGAYGGGAFLLCYLLIVFLVGFPVMLAELSIGRATQKNVVGAFRTLNPRWRFAGYIGIVTLFVILSYYCVVGGWVLKYVQIYAAGAHFGAGPGAYADYFSAFSARPVEPLLWGLGFLVLCGVVVNNGIVFVDYANQLRLGGLERRAALVATGKTRMRPILMTTLTTVLAMLQMVFSNDMASQLMSGMAIVIICGLSYATLMTLYIVPILYDILFKKPPLVVDVGDDGMDDIPDDAAEYIAQSNAAEAQPEA